MGPLATVDFMRKLVAATPTTVDQEHLPVVVYNVPQIPDRSDAFLAGSDAPWDYLLAGLRTLEQAGASLIAIPCNTAHVWHARLAAKADATILHIGHIACEALKNRIAQPRRVGLLATTATLSARIYHEELEADGIAVIEPDAATQQQFVMTGIRAVKAGHLAQGRDLLRAAAAQLTDVDVFLLACTEIPLALDDIPLGAPAIDTTDTLARACVTWWRAQSPHSPISLAKPPTAPSFPFRP